MARQADKDGRRTSGILTKADAIALATHSKWVPMLNGTKHRLDLEYYCVKNPNQAEVFAGITLKQAAASEVEFFSTDGFFSVQQHMVQRCGVDAVKTGLSMQLVQHMHQQLPEVKKAAQKRLHEVGL